MLNNREIEDLQRRIQGLQENSTAPAPEGTVWCPQDEIINLLALVTDHLNSKKEEKESYSRAVQRLASIESDIEHIRRDIASLCKVVRDGNGQPSMIHRLTNLETIVTHNREDIEEIRGHANSIIAAKALSKSQVIAGFMGMVITAILSSLALLATLLK